MRSILTFLPAICGALRTIHSPALRAAPTIRAFVVCKQRKPTSSSADDEKQKQAALIASLNMGMNSWSNFDDGNKKPATTKNAAKQKTNRKGKDGKVYLRDGPKRPPVVSKLAKRRMSTDAIADTAAQVETLELKAPVRIEESKSGGGKRATTIRGLTSDAANSVLKELKAALSVGGRVNARGDVEMQGAHAEVCLIRLQKAGYRDVRLAGGAGAKKTSAPMWNAPKEVKDRAAAQKQAAKGAELKKAEKARAAARTPAAVAAKMLTQLRASEQKEIAKLRRSDVPRAEKLLAQEKLDRIQQRIAESS